MSFKINRLTFLAQMIATDIKRRNELLSLMICWKPTLENTWDVSSIRIRRCCRLLRNNAEGNVEDGL